MIGIALDAAIPAIGRQIAQVASLKRPGARCAAGWPAQSPVVHQHEIHRRPQVVLAPARSLVSRRARRILNGVAIHRTSLTRFIRARAESARTAGAAGSAPGSWPG